MKTPMMEMLKARMRAQLMHRTLLMPFRGLSSHEKNYVSTILKKTTPRTRVFKHFGAALFKNCYAFQVAKFSYSIENHIYTYTMDLLAHALLLPFCLHSLSDNIAPIPYIQMKRRHK
jgi:hypothetical protein